MDATKTILDSFCKGYGGAYCQKLNDPVQTHAIYGIAKTSKEEVKAKLKAMGAKRFRSVQPHAKYLTIICFDAANIKSAQELPAIFTA